MIFNPCMAHQINLMTKNVHKKSQCDTIDSAIELVKSYQFLKSSFDDVSKWLQDTEWKKVAIATLGVVITR